jgi:hypothetical protein
MQLKKIVAQKINVIFIFQEKKVDQTAHQK